jgi:hypothetical protein
MESRPPTEAAGFRSAPSRTMVMGISRLKLIVRGHFR